MQKKGVILLKTKKLEPKNKKWYSLVFKKIPADAEQIGEKWSIGNGVCGREKQVLLNPYALQPPKFIKIQLRSNLKDYLDYLESAEQASIYGTRAEISWAS